MMTLTAVAFVSCEKSDDEMGDISGAPHYGEYRCVAVQTNGVTMDAEVVGFDVRIVFHEDGSYEEYDEGYNNYGSSFVWDKDSRSLILRYEKDGYGMFSGAGKGDIIVRTWTSTKLEISFTGYDEEGPGEMKMVLTFEKK